MKKQDDTNTNTEINENLNEYRGDIHLTDSEKETLSDEFADEPRQNFATGIPKEDFEDEEIGVSTVGKNSKGILKTAVITGSLIVGVLAVCLFFILRSTSKTDETVVKDNSKKTSVNANISDASDFGFQNDYQNRYSNVSNVANVNSMSSNDSLNYGTVGNITTAPPINYNGSIYQPNPVTSPTPVAQVNNSDIFGSNSGGGGGSTSNNSQTTKTQANAEIVEVKDNDNIRQTTGGGRNDQISLYFYERPKNSNEKAQYERIELETNRTVKLPFGAVLPVRILGRLHTLSTGGLARMELTRTMQGSWGNLPRGTIFVGRLSGGAANRVFVSLIGYIDLRSGKLVAVGGDLQGTDGGLGLEGNVKRLTSRWSRIFGEVINTAKELGSSYLLGRQGGGGTIINNGQLERNINALDNRDSSRYTIVPAGAIGYVVINDLPPAVQADEKLSNLGEGLTDEEIMRLISVNSSTELQQIMPSLSPNGQRVAQRMLDDK